MMPGQRQAVAQARRSLDMKRAGILPEDVSPEEAGTYWAGWLDEALARLLRELGEDVPSLWETT